MFKLCHQFIQQIKDYYFEYKKENDKCKELKNVLNSLFKLDYYFINNKSTYEIYHNKQNTRDIKINNINKINNNIIKIDMQNNKFSSNLPLNLTYLICDYINCNCPPNIIFISGKCDIHNLPKSLIFLLTRTNTPNELILNNINIKKKHFKIII